MHIRGKVTRQRFGSGSKSDHEAVLLVAPTGTFRLRRAGGNPFRDPSMDELVGHVIDGEGTLHGGMLTLHSWQVVPPGDDD